LNILDSRGPKLIALVVSDDNNLVGARRQRNLTISPITVIGNRVEIRLEGAIGGRIDAHFQIVVAGGFVVLEFQKSSHVDLHRATLHRKHLECLVGGAQKLAIVLIANDPRVRIAQFLQQSPLRCAAALRSVHTRFAVGGHAIQFHAIVLIVILLFLGGSLF